MEAIGRTCIREMALAAGLLLLVRAIEMKSGLVEGSYLRSRGFLHDAIYWFYYRTGLHQFLYAAIILAPLERPLAFLDVGVASALPAPVVLLLALVIGDFIGYWAHRAQHAFRVLWVFHTTHHTQQQLSILTGGRFHPVDAIWLALCAYIPMRILSGNAQLWPWLAFALWLINAFIHSRIPWSYGPLYKIVASPVFHAYHHSTDPAHHNKNFSSGLLNIWDYLFGTATKDNEPPPTQFGLPDVKPVTFISTLVTPFRLMFRPASAEVAPARLASSQGGDQTP